MCYIKVKAKNNIKIITFYYVSGLTQYIFTLNLIATFNSIIFITSFLIDCLLLPFKNDKSNNKNRIYQKKKKHPVGKTN